MRLKYTTFCRIAIVIAFVLISPCTVAAQDFSTVPDFPSDFTLIDPASPSATPTPKPTPASPTAKATTTPVKQSVPDTATGPESTAVVGLATLLGLVLLLAVRWYVLTATHHDSQS